MSKDFTNRGGVRVGSGPKKKSLAERLEEGKEAEMMLMPDPMDLEGVQMPDIKEYLSEDQRQGTLHGKEIYEEIWKWLAERNCAYIVSPQLLEQYSMAMGRYIQLEQITSEYGFISKHPTTGAAIASPFVTMAQGYLKQANILWQQIFYIVQANCTERVTGNPQDDLMERLLGM